MPPPTAAMGPQKTAVVIRRPSVLEGRDHDGAPDHFQSRVCLRIVVAVDRYSESQVLFVAELDFLGRILPHEFYAAVKDNLGFGTVLADIAEDEVEIFLGHVDLVAVEQHIDLDELQAASGLDPPYIQTTIK